MRSLWIYPTGFQRESQQLFLKKLTGESFNIFINYSNITTGNANINS
jgi:hypothetical protein